ncbi:GRAM domain-containing protein 2B-like isoform X1 [Empidonax traillii]|uniref:GRAM domain-containing protein 2B-like isoform X1 n=1 Tax=Empidonax traillii TaxID=164674 RepID=UPI000FFDAA86|nr:GRAM domain-containing protein 2B-like isoform X1 [Empidonax traillii]
MPGKLRRSARGVLGEKQWQSLEETGSARLGQPKLARSRTYDPSCKDTEQSATGGQGPPSPSLSKRDSSYRRAFGELAERDALLGCFSCAWQREVPYHGRLYVSSRHIFFHSSLLLKDIKAVIPVASVSALKKTNTALLVPNALSIRTAQGEKFLFVSLRQREATYQLLRSVCKQLQDSGRSPRDSVSNEGTLGKSLNSSQSDPEQSTPEPNSLHESLDEPSPRPREAEEEDDKVALLTPSSRELVPVAGTRSLWGGGAPHRALGLGCCTPVPDEPPAEPSQHRHHHLPAAHGGLAGVLGVHRAAHHGSGAAVGVRGGSATPQPATAVSHQGWGAPCARQRPPPSSPCLPLPRYKTT